MKNYHIYALAATISLIILLILGSLLINNKDKQPSVHQEKITNTTLQKPFYATSFNGSRILVVPDASGELIFYRDKDNDGWADSKGKFFYWFGVSNVLTENNLPPRKYRMEEIKKRFEKSNQ